MSQPDGGENERLRQELEVSLARAEAAEQRAGAAEQRAYAAVDRIVDVEQDLNQERLRSGNTTFPIFLELCHGHLSKNLEVQTDRSLTTKGSITSPKGKKHPCRLRPWDNFPQQQQQYFDAAYALLCPLDRAPPGLFVPPLVIENLGRTVCRRPLASERDLEQYERFAVEEKVMDVVGQLMMIPEAQDLINVCKELEFDNHLNSLSENAEEVLERQKRSRVDQACVFSNVDGNRMLTFVREYKAAHKLTVQYLRAGLRPMDVRKEVVQRLTIPQEPGAQLNYNADRLVAAAVTQTFEYMIDNGLEFSSIATGPAEVFLRIDEDDPQTVYYYLTEPRLDVGEADEFGFHYPFTGIARLLAFTLMAMHSSQRSQAWRNEAAKSLHVWHEDFEDSLNQLTPEERRATPPSSVYKPPTYPVNLGSPCLTRKRARAAQGGEDANLSFHSTTSSSGGSGNDAFGQAPASETPGRRGGGGTKTKRTSTQGPVAQTQSRQHCSQKCLLGLKQCGSLDLDCPNVEQHRRRTKDQSHDLDLPSFHRLLQSQLVSDMDHHCQPLGKQGARGAMFKITLVSHGYTLVAKGTVKSFVVDVRHEEKAYERLQVLQGMSVGVWLGHLDLERTYYLDVGVKIIHMMLMAWGGYSLCERTPPVPTEHLHREMQRSMAEVRQLGVIHGDERLANMLWNDSQQRVMLVDFGRSILQVEKPPDRPLGVLQEISPNKKRRVHREKSTCPPNASEVEPITGLR